MSNALSMCFEYTLMYLKKLFTKVTILLFLDMVYFK